MECSLLLERIRSQKELMIKTVLLLILFAPAMCFSVEDSSKRCIKPQDNEPVVLGTDFNWQMSRKDILDKSKHIYESGKRLHGRAYYNNELKSFVLTYQGVSGAQLVPFDMKFAKNISLHLEKALDLGYAEAVIFPDMGHSHFFIPIEKWKREYDSIPTNQFALLYEKLFKDSDLKILYHVAEQLSMMDSNHKLLKNRYLQKRYYTRNLMGFNNGSTDVDILFVNNLEDINSVSEFKNHFYFSAGFNVSASKNGCFSFKYNGKTHFFDISLQDLPYPQE